MCQANITTYNLARMNMLLHGVKDTEFDIFHGDTLTNEWGTLRELNQEKIPCFDAIVANLPLMNAPRSPFGLPVGSLPRFDLREVAGLSPLRSGLRMAR